MKKLALKYSVASQFIFKSLKQTLEFCEKCGYTTFVVSYKGIEKGYETTTWKTEKNIQFDFFCEIN